MPDVLFYHLERQPLEAVLPTLLQKTRERGWRAVVQATTDERMTALDDHLWTFTDDSFLAHGTDREPHGEEQPILLTLSAANPNDAAIRFLVESAGLPADMDCLPAGRHPVRRRRRPGSCDCARAMARREGRRPRGHLLAAG